MELVGFTWGRTSFSSPDTGLRAWLHKLENGSVFEQRQALVAIRSAGPRGTEAFEPVLEKCTRQPAPNCLAWAGPRKRRSACSTTTWIRRTPNVPTISSSVCSQNCTCAGSNVTV